MVHIVQYLCPARHCITAMAYEEPKPAELETQMLLQMSALGINPWCGLCGSRDLHFEDARTRYATLDEALPHIRQLEREQKLARHILGRY